ncbi:MAG: N-acetylgalactosamine-6-sulfatase [Pedosphaera sp.]|nr:N-acetylgalactosamine-6-sulfatase [Pedosphaera sp.]
MISSHFQKLGRQFRLLLFVNLLLGAFTAASAFAQDATNRPPAPRRPSIVFILADDLGYGDLGCYGQTKIKTPNIDKLAEQGMRFTSFYAGSTVCAPSRCALMTGKHTGHARIRGNSTQSLLPEDVTVAELLKQAGYNTGAIGKWGLGDEGSPGVPGKKGFDEWFGYLNQVDAHNYYPMFLNRSDAQGERQVELSENFDGKKGRYSHDFFTEAALNFVRINQPVWYTHYQPFFLYLAYTIPHANDELGQKTGNGMEVPSDAPNSAESWPQVEKNKAAMITRLDHDVGLLMDKLKELKIDTNTIVIFTSDNGPHKEGGVNPKFFKSSGPLRGIKRDLYEGGIRMPLIVSWPARIKPGSTSDLPCAFWDFLPTAAEIVDKKTLKDIDGISLLPTLVGQAQTNRHEFLYWEFHEGGFKQAVRMGDWKAVRFGVDGPLELYNLKTDLGEKTNVAEQNPGIVARIEEYLKTARTEDPAWPVKTAAQTSKKEYGQ